MFSALLSCTVACLPHAGPRSNANALGGVPAEPSMPLGGYNKSGREP